MAIALQNQIFLKMSFDKDSAGVPLVQPQKKTTQVNIGIAVGIVIFFVVVGLVLWGIVRNPEETRSDVHEKVQQSK